MIRPLALLLVLIAAAPAAAQGLPPGEKAIATRLVAESDTGPAGGSVTLALVMKPRSGWHGYWLNPGDAGVGMRIDWRLPPGVEAGPIRYPVPERLVIQGLMNYVYEDEFAPLIELRLPTGLAPGTRVPVRGKADYLACTDEICVPESADIGVDLVVGPARPRQDEFDRYREALPKPLGSPASFEREGRALRLGVPLPAELRVLEAYFFPATEDSVRYSAAQRVSRAGDLLVIETESGRKPAERIEGVLKIDERQGLWVSAAAGDVPAGLDPLTGRGEPLAILAALAGAMLGGLLLNVMPCVFPILSLKALSLARAGESERAARSEALAYTGGVVLVCTALGGALLALRAGGEAVGWAFQLQDPRIILFLFLLVAAVGLNLLGLFELPSLGGGRSGDRPGAAGAFATGALAAFVATPCTGPFMGAALGAALVLPTLAALAVFAGLGLGLALPFLLLGFVPRLRRRLPKPGRWMDRFRRILSIPMFLTALALAWVLERQSGGTGLVTAVAAALLLAALLWWAGRRQRWIAFAPAAAALGAAVAALPALASPVARGGEAVLDARRFSEKRLVELRREGRPVFVYFTADWCLTCKVNEQAVLAREEVAQAFDEAEVAVLVGDWTRGDAEIGRFLERHGRSGVPLYLWYPAGGEARVLPQILTPAAVAGLTAS